MKESIAVPQVTITEMDPVLRQKSPGLIVKRDLMMDSAGPSQPKGRATACCCLGLLPWAFTA